MPTLANPLDETLLETYLKLRTSGDTISKYARVVIQLRQRRASVTAQCQKTPLGLAQLLKYKKTLEITQSLPGLTNQPNWLSPQTFRKTNATAC